MALAPHHPRVEHPTHQGQNLASMPIICYMLYSNKNVFIEWLYNEMLSPPPGFKSHEGTSLVCFDKSQGVGSPTLVESQLLLIHKYFVYLACRSLDIILVLQRQPLGFMLGLTHITSMSYRFTMVNKKEKNCMAKWP